MIKGTGLAAAEAIGTVAPLGTSLGGVSVSVAGITAPLFYVSPGQINFLVPYEVAIPADSNVPVVVTNTAGSSAPYKIRLTPTSPAVFTMDATGSGKPHIYELPSYKPAEELKAGQEYMIYAAGLGQTSPPASSSAGGNAAEPLNRVLVDNLEVYLGDTKATVNYAGLAPGYQGIYQLNVVPNAPATDRVYLRSKAWQSNITTVPPEGGGNVANVTGDIEGMIPAGPTYQALLGVQGPPPSSVALIAGSFKVAFDILPNAKPFTVVAAGEAGSTTILIDPVKGTYEATATVPNARTRMGDFSYSEFAPLVDYLSCRDGAVCDRFPGDIIPISRLDPVMVRALQMTPMPNVPDAFTPSMGLLKTSGELKGSRFMVGSRFVMDDPPDFISINKFAGWLKIPYGPDKTYKTTFSLYVDGKLIASREASFPVVARQ